MTSKKILVTGCAGFVGFHLVKKILLKKNYQIIGVDNINNYYDIKKNCSATESQRTVSPYKVFIDNNGYRYSGKKRDDLQSAMQLIEDLQLGIPVQFINFRD